VDPFHERNGPTRSIDRLKNFCNAIQQALIDDMFRHQLHLLGNQCRDDMIAVLSNTLE
jgi:hypothetical protein